MADNTLQLLFKADTKDLDSAKEKLQDIGKEMPNVGDMISGLVSKFASIPGPVGLAVAAVGGFGFAISEMVKSTIEAETQLLEFSEAMGIPVEKAQPFIEAMALAGVSSDKLQAGLSKLSVSVGAALSDPTGKAADTFKKLGISQQELKEGDLQKIFEDTVKGLSKYADGAEKVRIERELLAKGGPALVAAAQQEAQFTKMAADAQEQYGTKISDSDAKSAKYFSETLKLGMSMFDGVSMSVTKSLLPGLQELVNEFAESGKQGGVLRDILDAASWTVTNLGRLILTLLVEPVRYAIEIFKEAGTAIGASMAAIAAAAHGHLGEAKQIMHDMGQDLKQMTAEYEANSTKFTNALWGIKDPLEAIEVTAKKIQPTWTDFDASAKKIAETLEQLRQKMVDQRTVMEAAGHGLEQYKQAQDDVAIGQELLKLKTEGASKSVLAQAEAMMRAANASKQATSDEVAGWTLINRLKEQNLGLTTHQTELEKNLADIANHPGMTEAEKQQATALANTNQELTEQNNLKKIIQGLDAQVTKDIGAEVAVMTLSTNELKKYNQELKIKQQAEKEMQGKSVAEQKQIQEALKQDLQLLEAQNNQVIQLQQSWQGFGMGAVQAIQNAANEAQNLYKIGGQLVNQFNNDLTNAFMKAMQGGKDAFKELMASVGQMIAQQIMKFAITQAELAVLQYYGISGQSAATLLGAAPTKNANGNAFVNGNVQAFADGGIVSSPTYFNMGLMGEAGPEAIMPLSKDSQGRLGVNVNGGGTSSSGGAVHIHGPSITINSNQDPHEIGKQVRKQLKIHEQMTKSVIAKQQRPGGMLHNKAPMLS